MGELNHQVTDAHLLSANMPKPRAGDDDARRPQIALRVEQRDSLPHGESIAAREEVGEDDRIEVTVYLSRQFGADQLAADLERVMTLLRSGYFSWLVA